MTRRGFTFYFSFYSLVRESNRFQQEDYSMINDPLIKGIARPSWDESFMLDAIKAATRSSCLKRAVGAALVKGGATIATGYSGAARGQESCLDLEYCHYEHLAQEDGKKGIGTFDDLRERYKTFCIAVHAEANTVGHISRLGGQGIEGAVLYITNFPCPKCVQDVIVTNQISAVVFWKDYLCNPLLTLDEKRASEAALTRASIPWRQVAISKERIKQIAALMVMVGERTEYRFASA